MTEPKPFDKLEYEYADVIRGVFDIQYGIHKGMDSLRARTLSKVEENFGKYLGGMTQIKVEELFSRLLHKDVQHRSINRSYDHEFKVIFRYETDIKIRFRSGYTEMMIKVKPLEMMDLVNFVKVLVSHD